MPKKDYKRRTKLLIAKKFQIKYIFFMTFIVLTAVAMTAYTVYVTTWLLFGEKLAAVYPQNILIEISENINRAIMLRLAILIPCSILLGLVFSSRIAGPVFNIKRYLHKLSHGAYDMTEVKLRENDEFNDLAHEVNNLVDRIKSDRDNRDNGLDAIIKELDKIDGNISEGKSGTLKVKSSLSAIRRQVDVLKR